MSKFLKITNAPITGQVISLEGIKSISTANATSTDVVIKYNDGTTTTVTTAAQVDHDVYTEIVNAIESAIATSFQNAYYDASLSKTVTSITNAANSPALLLDTYPAASGWSYRKLSSTYTGAVIRLRRDSDNNEKDFFFDSNGRLSLDSEDGLGTSISSWTGEEVDAFCVIMYDQSGNGLDISQNTLSRQPLVIEQGDMWTAPSGQPAMLYNEGAGLASEAALITTNNWSIYVSCNFEGEGATQNNLTQHDGTGAIGRIVFLGYRASEDPNGYDTFFNNGSSYFNQSTAAYTSNMQVFSSRATSNNYFLSVNDNEEQIITGQSLTPLNTPFIIGNTASFSNGLYGTVNECIVYSTSNSTDRSAIEQNMIDNMINI
jgi:hypothetical protein